MSKLAEITLVVTAMVLIGVSLAIVYPRLSEPTREPLLDWKDNAVVARGAKLYAEQCASCHGSIGGSSITNKMNTIQTSAPSHDADGHTWEHPDFALVQLTKTGEVAELCRNVSESTMPEFGQALSDRQIVDVLTYIKSTWPKDIRMRHDEINLLYEGQNTAVRELLDLSES
ncbi:MAG: cytochrome c [Hyphomicrobiales bacterium]|nr:cytochrome c [Hyphomicrobiales bacterium]